MDKYVMYYVLDKKQPHSTGQLIADAGALSVLCLQQFEQQFEQQFAQWNEQLYRKIALRADQAQIKQISSEFACVQRDDMLCLPPVSQAEAQRSVLSQLRPVTDCKQPQSVPATVEGVAVDYLISDSLKSVGKAIAQAGHASVLLSHKYDLSPWMEEGCPGRAWKATDEQWEYCKTLPSIVVCDAGLTQVEAGTETIVAVTDHTAQQMLEIGLQPVP